MVIWGLKRIFFPSSIDELFFFLHLKAVLCFRYKPEVGTVPCYLPFPHVLPPRDSTSQRGRTVGVAARMDAICGSHISQIESPEVYITSKSKKKKTTTTAKKKPCFIIHWKTYKDKITLQVCIAFHHLQNTFEFFFLYPFNNLKSSW
jgi:hypothetical protein